MGWILYSDLLDVAVDEFLDFRIDTVIRVAMALGLDLTLMPADHAGHEQAVAVNI
jgi:hypothetical protein